MDKNDPSSMREEALLREESDDVSGETFLCQRRYT